jgi:hypothetical protein
MRAFGIAGLRLRRKVATAVPDLLRRDVTAPSPVGATSATSPTCRSPTGRCSSRAKSLKVFPGDSRAVEVQDRVEDVS